MSVYLAFSFVRLHTVMCGEQNKTHNELSNASKQGTFDVRPCPAPDDDDDDDDRAGRPTCVCCWTHRDVCDTVVMIVGWIDALLSSDRPGHCIHGAKTQVPERRAHRRPAPQCT